MRPRIGLRYLTAPDLRGAASTQWMEMSEMLAKLNPAGSDRSAWATRVGASNSSQERV
ncbi:MAG: hypothetical protein AB7T48_00255 [Solirubrobacterales bacterium]